MVGWLVGLLVGSPKMVRFEHVEVILAAVGHAKKRVSLLSSDNEADSNR